MVRSSGSVRTKEGEEDVSTYAKYQVTVVVKLGDAWSAKPNTPEDFESDLSKLVYESLSERSEWLDIDPSYISTEAKMVGESAWKPNHAQ